MASIIRGDTGRVTYPRIVEYVRDSGAKRSPRGRPTRDYGFTMIELRTPTNALPIDTGRGLNTELAAVEALQLIGGVSAPERLLATAPQIHRYMDDGAFHGAYGSRIGVQMLHVARKLREDPSTRQAVVTLWDPTRDNVEDKHDYPCTVALQFEITNHQLHMNTIMRSNDVWLGLPYDMFQFTQLQITLAVSLGVPFGMYRHVALSLHMYEDDVVESYNVHPPRGKSYEQPRGVGELNQPFDVIMKRARRLLSNQELNEPNEHEEWYRERIAKTYVG